MVSAWLPTPCVGKSSVSDILYGVNNVCSRLQRKLQSLCRDDLWAKCSHAASSQSSSWCVALGLFETPVLASWFAWSLKNLTYSYSWAQMLPMQMHLQDRAHRWSWHWQNERNPKASGCQQCYKGDLAEEGKAHLSLLSGSCPQRFNFFQLPLSFETLNSK